MFDALIKEAQKVTEGIVKTIDSFIPKTSQTQKTQQTQNPQNIDVNASIKQAQKTAEIEYEARQKEQKQKEEFVKKQVEAMRKNPVEKAVAYASTMATGGGWDLIAGALPDVIEAPLRKGWNATFGQVFGKVKEEPIKTPVEVGVLPPATLYEKITQADKKTKSRNPDVVVAEEIYRVGKKIQQTKGSQVEKFATFLAEETLQSPLGVATIEHTANVVGGALVSRIGGGIAKKGIGIGLAGSLEGALSSIPLASQYYKQTGDLGGALIIEGVSSAFGFGSAYMFGLPFLKGGKARKVSLGLAYAIDFPGEISGDVATETLERVSVPSLSSVLTNIFAPSNVPSQTPAQVKTNTQQQSPTTQQSLTNVISQMFSQTPVPSQTPSTTPTNVPTQVPTQTPTNVPEQTTSNTPEESTTNVPTPALVPTSSIVPTPKLPFLIPPPMSTKSKTIAKPLKSKFVNELDLAPKLMTNPFLILRQKRKQQKKRLRKRSKRTRKRKR